jgi:putative transposase
VSRAERATLLELDGSTIPLSVQAELLGVSRSSLYYTPRPPLPDEAEIRRRIDEIYTAHPFFGSRRITEELCRQGWHVNRKRIQRCMRDMQIAGICPGPNLSRRDLQSRLFPYLLRDLEITRSNQVWGIDITYIRLRESWMYLVAVIDWFSRYIVGWEVDQTLQMPFVLAAVGRALDGAKPEILNSDQGSHFTSLQYIDLVSGAGVQISMDGKGRAWDNIFIERFWRSLKYEEVYLKDYSIPREARLGIEEYMRFYNHHRPHQALGYRTPAEVYLG